MKCEAVAVVVGKDSHAPAALLYHRTKKRSPAPAHSHSSEVRGNETAIGGSNITPDGRAVVGRGSHAPIAGPIPPANPALPGGVTS